MIELLVDRFGKRELLTAENVDGEILQDDGEADGADQRRERAVLWHRTHRDKERERAEHRAGDHGAEQRDIDVGAGVQDQKQPDEGANHEHFAVREIEQVEHAENQRVADRDQRIGSAEHQAIDQLLVNHVGP